MLRPALTKVATGGPSPMFGIIGPPRRPLGGMRLSHTPETSGLPAGLGAGALRLGAVGIARHLGANERRPLRGQRDRKSQTAPGVEKSHRRKTVYSGYGGSGLGLMPVWPKSSPEP